MYWTKSRQKRLDRLQTANCSLTLKKINNMKQPPTEQTRSDRSSAGINNRNRILLTSTRHAQAKNYDD